jgi:hypothetical protein
MKRDRAMITAFSFGKIEVKGQTYHDDIKILNGQVIADWWRKSGHRVDILDVADILESEPDILVLGKGSPGLMRSTAALRDYLSARKVELIEKKTTKAVEVFNKLFEEGRKVAGGFHITC